MDVAPYNIVKIIEGLRAVRDHGTNLQGLKDLRKAVRGQRAPEALQEFLTRSKECEELQAVWDAQLKAKDDDVTAALLLLIADLLNLSTTVELAPEQQRCLSQLALSIISRRLKTLYFYLGSDVRAKANAALSLLAAIARHSTQAARDLVQAFDFTLSALPRLCKLPREKKEIGADEAQQRLWRFWRSADVAKRPSAALFAEFALALLQAADAQLLCTLLPVRPIFAGLLHNLGQFPPEAALSILTSLQDRVLGMGDAIPADLQAEPFGDTALSQIAAVAAWEAPAEEEEASSNADLVIPCAGAAQQMLLELGTNPAHGLAPGGGDHGSSTENIGGRKRLQRFLQGLRVTTAKAHYDLLLAMTAAQPTLAAAYSVNNSLSLEPRPSLRWWAGVSLVGSVIQQASQVPLPYAEQARRGERPPSMDSGLVTGLLRRLFPACLPKAALSRGIQHSSPLVRYATLCTLRQILEALHLALAAASEAAEWVDQSQPSAASQQTDTVSMTDPRLQAVATHSGEAHAAEMTDMDLAATEGEVMDIDEAVHTAAESGDHGEAMTGVPVQTASSPRERKDTVQPPAQGNEGEAYRQADQGRLRGNAWRGFLGRLRSAARGRLPDLQPLLALLATLHADIQSTQDKPPPVEVGEEGNADFVTAGGMSSAQMTLVQLLAVLRGYLRCMPETFAEARFDISRLLPEDILSHPPIVQHGILGLMEAGSSVHSPSEASLSTGHVSSAALTPLLRLLCGSELPEITGAAEAVLRQRLEEAVGLEDSPAEVHLWLEMLPSRLGSPEQSRCADAVAGFLAEAVALLSRKPQEFHEAERAILSPQTSTGNAMRHGQHSLLVVAALRQAVRVAASTKMPADARTAIACYVAGALGALLRVQAHAEPLVLVIVGVIRAEAAQLKANPPNALAEADGDAAKTPRKKRKHKEDREGTGDQSGAALSLPIEAQPLASLMELAQRVLLKEASGATAVQLETPRRSSGVTANGGMAAPVTREAKKRGKQADGGSAGGEVTTEPASSGFPNEQPGGLSSKEVQVAGSEEADAQLSAYLEQSMSARALEPLQLQTVLLCAPAAAVAAKVPTLARLVTQQPEEQQDGCLQVLIRACQAHSVPVLGRESAAQLMSGDTIKGDEWRGLERLLDASPASLLLLTATSLPGEAEAVPLLKRLHERLLTASPQQAIVPILAALACVPHASNPSTLTALFELVTAGLKAGVEGSIHPDTPPAVLAAILGHPALAQYLTARKDALNLEWTAERDRQITRLLSQLLSGSTAPGISKDIADTIQRLTRPFLDRAVEALSSCQAAELQSTADWPLADACITLAVHLSSRQLAALATKLLSAAGEERSPCAATAALLEAGLSLADRLFATYRSSSSSDAAGRDSGSLAAVLKAVAALVANGQSAAAERCLAEALSVRFSQPSMIAWYMTDNAAGILELCVAQPSDLRSRIGATLIDALPPCRAALADLLPARLQAQDGKEALALLLPLMYAYLRHASQAQQAPEQDPVVLSCKDRLLAYMVSKRKPAGASVSVSRGAAASLDSFAAPVLRQCMIMSPPSESADAASLLQRLCPADGWQPTPVQTEAPAAFMIGPLPAQQAATAELLLHGVLKIGVSEEVAAECIVRFAQACTATLARVMKPQSGDNAASELRAQLSGYMDGVIKTSIAAHLGAVMSAEAFPALCAALSKLALSILRHRFSDAATVSLLRRLCAAFIPRARDEGISGELKSSEVARTAAKLAELLISHSQFVPMMLSNPGDCPPPLPKLAANLQQPLSSILPLVELDPVDTGMVTSDKAEVVGLLETLLELHRHHLPGALPSALQEGVGGLVPVLLSGYGASCSATDRATLLLLLLINSCLCEEEIAASPAEAMAVLHITTLFSGPLAKAGFLWGPAARAEHKAASDADEAVQPSARAAIIKDTAVLDARRSALSVIHYPEQCSLLPAGDQPLEALSSSTLPACSAAGYDPAFLVPFTLQGLRDGSIGCLDMANWGLLSLLLRCLASADDALRGMAYEALALYADTLERSTFREKAQLVLLLRALRLSVERPFQRLPTLTALFLSEAACALAHPAADMYPALNRHLLRRATLDIQDAPLLKQLLSSGGQEQAAERLWLLRLLAAGFRSSADGDIFRRRFVAELLMSLHDSPLGDAALQAVALRTLCSAPQCAPTYAADLVQHAGVVFWLAAVAQEAVARHGSANASVFPSLLLRVVSALRGFLAAKAWKAKGRSGGLGILDAFAKAASSLCRTLTGSASACRDSQVVEGVVGFALDVQQAALSGRSRVSLPTFTLLSWADARALVHALGPQAGQSTLELLLQVMLALPPPETGLAGDFGDVAAWMQDACTCLLSPEKKTQQPTQAFTAEQLWAEKAPPSHHLVARTLLWLSVCVASGSRLRDTGLSTDAGVFSTAHAAAMPSAVPAADCFGRAQRLVQLYTAMHPRLQKEVRGPMVLLAAHVLQPAAAMLLGTPLDGRNAADQAMPLAEKRPDQERWSFLLGNTLLRVLGHLPVPAAGAAEWWFRAARPEQPSGLGSQQEHGDESASAAAELGMVILSELCLKQPAHMTCALLGRWERGSEGTVKKEMAELELLHARRIALNLGT